MNGRDLFLSHSSADVDVARALRADLETAGFGAWMAPDDVVGTETWAEQILAAIARSRALIVLISANSNRSAHVSREVNLALSRGLPVLPIRIEDVAPEGSLEYLLSLVQRVDAFPLPISGHRDRIIRRLEALLRPDATPPPPPPDPADPVTEPQTQEAGSPAGPKKKPAAGDAKAPRPRPAARRRSPRRPADGPPRTAAGIGSGSVVDDFTLETLLGEGGMGTVYRARQAEPSRAVALKVIRADHAADETYRRRFLAEKDTLASLEHPAIVPIYAAGEDDGVLYIAMRLVDGSDLHARIAAQGRLSLRETVDVLRPIADAIDYAHGMGIIHRDLKPSNIILDRHGRPYLTDFGLGKRVERPSQITQQGVALGTLDYMAPEQFTGTAPAELASRIDVYALGCVAYACLTGKPPFQRDTPEQLMYAHAHDRPTAIQTLRPELPKAIDDVLQRALAKDPASRHASATELIAALETAFTSTDMGQTRKVAVQQGGLARATGLVRSNLPIAAIGGALGLIAIVILIAYGNRDKPGPTAGPGSSSVAGTPGGTSTAATTRPTVAPAGISVTRFTASATEPVRVSLAWTTSEPSEKVRIYRDSVLLYELPGTTSSIIDYVSAGATYTYAIDATAANGTSPAVEQQVITPRTPSGAEALVYGPWTASITYTESSYTGRVAGETYTEPWDIDPACDAGACQLTMTGLHGEDLEVLLEPVGNRYTGTYEYSILELGCGTVTYSGEIRLTVDDVGFTNAGLAIADALTGTMSEQASATSCLDSGAEMDLRLGVRATPDDFIAPFLDDRIRGCGSAEPPAEWRESLANSNCNDGPTRPVSFYVYESSSKARDAMEAWLEDRNLTGAGGCLASPGVGYGPYLIKEEAAGQVICGAPQGEGDSETRIYAWTWLPGALVAYARWDDGDALTKWWANPANWLSNDYE